MRPQVYSDDRIFESISVVLAQQGYEALTLNNIAVQAKLSPAILSKRFGSKKGMLLAYYESLVKATQKGFSKLSEHALPLADALTEILTQWLIFIKNPQECSNFMMLYLKLSTEQEFIEISKRRHKIIDAEVKAILEKSMRRGEMQCQDIAGMSLVLQAAVTGAAMLWCRDDENIDPRRFIATCIKTIIGSNSGGGLNEQPN
ncbi:MAG: TetR/AcrR family transcriptional regulator [Clostridiales bacterium]|nr:TetR/AcrR family transcriptional regulator [Clostridiales bacterium]